MSLKKLSTFFVILFFALVIFYLKLTISDKCKSIKIFSSSLDFGLSHLDGCYSKSNLVPEIKSLLSNSSEAITSKTVPLEKFSIQ